MLSQMLNLSLCWSGNSVKLHVKIYGLLNFLDMSVPG